MEKQSEELNMDFSELVAFLLWIAGVVVAKGGWSTFFAIIFPPWSVYVLIEYFFKLIGWM